VTGGSRGIGAAIARRLAADGADVAITYQRSAEAAEKLAAEIRATGRKAVAIAADSADSRSGDAAVAATVAALGGLDILVNNAGIFEGGKLEEMSLADIERSIAVNVTAVALASRAAIPHFGPGSRIINIGSCLASHVPGPGMSIYAMTKAALVGLTKGLARDLGASGTTVNIVHPGPTDTDMNPADSERADGQRQAMALGHYGTADDVAASVAFLASDDARQITGAELAVDGGANA
jgi:NAD(P)-dependent dehydrogenase (short-subunit alcohol dehydrogenase family)